VIDFDEIKTTKNPRPLPPVRLAVAARHAQEFEREEQRVLAGAGLAGPARVRSRCRYVVRRYRSAHHYVSAPSSDIVTRFESVQDGILDPLILHTVTNTVIFRPVDRNSHERSTGQPPPMQTQKAALWQTAPSALA
jgi:hypothetical protein